MLRGCSFLSQRRKVPPGKIICMAVRSEVGQRVIWLRNKQRKVSRSGASSCRGPLLSVFRVAFHFRFTLWGDMFPNIDRAPFMTDTPILIVHGTKDEVVPVWHGQEPYLAFPRAKCTQPLWIQSAGHNNIESSASKIFFQRLQKFITEDVLSERT